MFCPRKLSVSFQINYVYLISNLNSIYIYGFSLEEILGNKTTEDEIRDALDKVCNTLPDSVQKQCVTLVNQYSETIIDFLTHQLTPDEVCKQIGLCAG